jgi:hypothetical protein
VCASRLPRLDDFWRALRGSSRELVLVGQDVPSVTIDGATLWKLQSKWDPRPGESWSGAGVAGPRLFREM